MSQITYFTKQQNRVEKWIGQLGIRVKSEVDVENFRVDLAILDLGIVVEIDGPSHKKVKKEGTLVTTSTSNISKRDRLLLEYYQNGIYHTPVDMEEEDFKREFLKIVENLK